MNRRQIASILCLLLAFAPAAHAWTPFGGGYKQQVKADNIETDTTNFNGACSASDTNVQMCLDQLDDAVSGGFTSGTITGKTLVTAASGDNLIIADASDGYNLKKVDAADFLAAGAGDITSVVAGAGLTGGATSGVATLDIGEGLAIDAAADSVAFDPTELTGNRTWADGTDATIAWTWNLSGTDPVWTFGSGTAALTGNISATNLSGTNTGDQTTITGNAGTATALAANGANASAGNAILGVDASGAAEGAFDVWTEAENTAAAYLNATAANLLYQPLEATLTDIADGTIDENLVNTANPWADNEVSDTITVGASGSVNDSAIPSGITRDTEWDTESEVQTAWGSVNILLATEIDTSSELRNLLGDESGTGALLFAGGDIAAGTATTPSADDNDTSVATTAYVQTELNASGGRSITCASGTCDADAELYTDTKCVRFENPVAADDLKSIWYAKNATTITSLWCESDQTVTAMLQVDDGSPADVDNTDLTCDSTPPEDTSLDGDTTMAAGDRLDLDIASVSGTPTWVTICWTTTKDE